MTTRRFANAHEKQIDVWSCLSREVWTAIAEVTLIVSASNARIRSPVARRYSYPQSQHRIAGAVLLDAFEFAFTAD